MSVQSLLGSSNLVAIGIGAGDVATLYTLGRRLGNWLTAPTGDAELLALLEEDEFDILQRRGIIDMNRFQSRWSSLRLLENGQLQRFEGEAVEKLLQKSSRFTAMMMCIVATLEEFASSSTIRVVCKSLLKRLFSGRQGPEMTEDLLNSNLGIRINGWRSAAAVRAMNVDCRKIRGDLLTAGLVVAGFMPQHDSHEVSDFLHWLIAGNTEKRFTASSDVAGIAYCLCRLSFEILTVENFGQMPANDTGCRLVYNKAPLFDGRERRSSDSRSSRQHRELSTTISLTQPEETFSTFPITRELATTCRMAWEEGENAGKHVHLGPGDPSQTGFTDYDLTMRFSNRGTPIVDQRRADTKSFRLGSLLAIFNSQEVHEGLKQILGRVSPDVLALVADVISASDESKSMAGLTNEATLEAFTCCQAFFMGYYYQIFSAIVDSSLLEIKTVSGHWGYGSPAFLRRMESFFQEANSFSTGCDRKTVFLVSRTNLLSLLANLYANMDINLRPSPLGTRLSHQEFCVGAVGKRIILTRSLVQRCMTAGQIAQFILLDSDPCSIPQTVEGLVFTGVPSPFPTWEGEPPKVSDNVSLKGPREDCTRHIEADWDGVPERLLLSIRYKGRRLGALNPAHADITFWKASIESRAGLRQSTFGPAHECELEDFVVSSRIVTAGRHQPNMPVVVHSRAAPTLRYAAAAWYSEVCDVVMVNECFREAMEHWKGTGDQPGARSRAFIALIG